MALSVPLRGSLTSCRWLNSWTSMVNRFSFFFNRLESSNRGQKQPNPAFWHFFRIFDSFLVNSRHFLTDSREDLSFRSYFSAVGRDHPANSRSHLSLGRYFSGFSRNYLLSGRHFLAGVRFLLPFCRHFDVVGIQVARWWIQCLAFRWQRT